MLYLFDCLIVKSCSIINYRVCGAMDNASDYGSEDSRFESWQTRRKYPFLERTHTWIWIVCENGILGFWIELFYCGGDRWTKGPCPLLYWKLPKKYTPPRRGIEPRSPAWQAGILTTILPRSCSPIGTVMGNLKCTYKKNTIFFSVVLPNFKTWKTTMHKIKIWSLYLIQRCQSKFYLLWLILTHFFHIKSTVFYPTNHHPQPTPPPPQKRKKERKKQTN